MSSSAITFESPSNSPPPTTAGPPASGVPKFKSIPPSSLPIYPRVSSPSSYFTIPGDVTSADLLDSPVLLSSSHNLLSPTTGSFTFNFNTNNQNQEQGIKKENNFTDLQFQTFSNSPTELYQQPRIEVDRNVEKAEYPPQKQSFRSNHANYNNQSSQKKLNDGYNWRKYGQKQVKGSENPRSYYKCTFQNCSMRKKVESSLDGEITQIVYKGNHNHPKPQSIKRSSSSSGSYNSVLPRQFNDFPDQSHASGQWDLIGNSEISSVSIGDDEFDQSRFGGDEFLDDEIHAKRLKMESENEGISIEGSSTLRKPRVVVQTISDVDILDDGYRWRKYGQKVVKGNHNPRSYYKCTTNGCSVRKHVERASHDLKSVLTTYEGKHNHNVPMARGFGQRQSLSTNRDNIMTNLSHHHPSNVLYDQSKSWL